MFYSDLTKAQILDLIMDKFKEEYELKENAICGDEKEISEKFCNRYDCLSELVNECHIYALVEVK